MINSKSIPSWQPCRNQTTTKSRQEKKTKRSSLKNAVARIDMEPYRRRETMRTITRSNMKRCFRCHHQRRIPCCNKMLVTVATMVLPLLLLPRPPLRTRLLRLLHRTVVRMAVLVIRTLRTPQKLLPVIPLRKSRLRLQQPQLPP
jgi:hypothetical protein